MRRPRLGLLLRWKAALGVLLAVVAGVYAAGVQPGEAWGDAAAYVAHARNLVEGRPYVDTGYLFNSQSYLAPQSYPYGFPLFLAPLYALFGLNWYALELGVVALFLATLGVLVLLFARSGLPPAYLAGAVLLFAGSPDVWELAHSVVSDVPFLLPVYSGLWALCRAYQAPPGRREQVCWALLAGACFYGATATRMLGVALPVSLAVFEAVWHRRLTRVGGCALGAALALHGGQAALAWLAAAAPPPASAAAVATAASPATAGSGYADLFLQDVVGRLLRYPQGVLLTVEGYLGALNQYWSNGHAKVLSDVLAGGASLLALAGWSRRIYRQASVNEVFAAVYLVLLLPWSFSDVRYLLPVMPLYFFYVMDGARHLGRAALSRRHGLLGALVVMLALASYAGRYAADPPFAAPAPEQNMASAPARALYAHIRAHTAPEAPFVFRKPRALALYTRRPATTFHAASDEELLSYFDARGVRYTVEGPPDPRDRLSGLARRHPDRFEQVYQNSAFQLYRYRPCQACESPARTDSD